MNSKVLNNKTMQKNISCINKKTIKKSFIDSLPVMAGYIFMGMGFGVLLQKNGYRNYGSYNRVGVDAICCG